MNKFMESLRDRQLEMLDQWDSRESLGNHREYIISDYETKKVLDSCKCAGTAAMLLAEKYNKTNVWISRI